MYDDPLLKACYDSTGKALVNNGNGHYIIYNSTFKTINEEGEVKDGRKAGIWKGLGEDGRITFTELYEAGKLIKGTAADSMGTYAYTTRLIKPRYKNGIKSFYNFITTQIRYPSADRSAGTEGTVLLTFEVNKSGIVKNIKVIRPVFPSIDAEAIHALSNCKDWLPAVSFGRLVNMEFTIPIIFALGVNYPTVIVGNLQ